MCTSGRVSRDERTRGTSKVECGRTRHDFFTSRVQVEEPEGMKGQEARVECGGRGSYFLFRLYKGKGFSEKEVRRRSRKVENGTTNRKFFEPCVQNE